MNAKLNPQAGDPGAQKRKSGTGVGETNSTVETLFMLGAEGFKMFPLRPDEKRPLVGQWEQWATNDPKRLEKWSKGAGIGVACGPSGLVVIDCDTHGEIPAGSQWDQTGIKDGIDVFAALWERHSPGTSMFDTLTVTTPSGGLHLYFRAPRSVTVRNSAGKIGPMIDVRATGGYVVGPNTTTAANTELGTVEGTYSPTYGAPKLPVLPVWLTRLAAPPRPAHAQQKRTWALPSRTGGRVQALAERVANAQPGQRNHLLNWAAWQLAQDHVLTRENAEILLNAGLTAGLGAGECMATINSAARGTEAAA